MAIPVKKLVLEVGVNQGQDTPRLLDTYPDALYFGFEPTIELYQPLVSHYAGNARVKFLPFAVSSFNGFAEFKIAGQSNWGCSSLFDFAPNIHEDWPGRWDFKVTHTYPVPVMRMDRFIDTFASQQAFEIEYAWIDAQGSDLEVLKSFGYHLKRLKAGRLEVALTTELYAQTNNTVANAEKFLRDNGFKFTVTPDNVGRECDIEFSR